MKDKTGLTLAVTGIFMLLGIIAYQAETEKSVTYLIPIALAVNLIGVFIHMKKNRKS